MSAHPKSLGKEPESLAICHWSQQDKPREKLISIGKNALSDAELIALLIGSGSAKESAVDLSNRILGSVGHNLNALGKLTLSQLMHFKGIGQAKAIAIVAALELGRRRRSEEPLELTSILSSKSVFDLMHSLIGELPHEEFWVLYLNNSNKILFKLQLSKGGMLGTVVDIRILFRVALEQYATAIILVHNHPSGKLQPSEADIQITKKIKLAGTQMDIPVLDHVIITDRGYYSFADEGTF